MNKNIKYLSDREKARLQLLEDEIYMLNNKVQRTIKKRDLLQKEVKRITELLTKTTQNE